MKYPVFHNLKQAFLRFAELKYAILILLIANFMIRLLFYFNTTQFVNISESASIFHGLELLKNGNKLYAFSSAYSMALSYVAYFFYHYLGSLHWFFVFQCLLSTITSFLVYLIIYKVNKNKISAINGLILTSFYLDFILLSSVAYNQTAEIFFTTLSILLIFELLRTKTLINYIFIAFLVFATIYISLFFRGTLKFLYFIFIIAAIINFFKTGIRNKTSIRLIITFLAFYFSFLYLSPSRFFSEPNNTISNSFLFFGHTSYGGGEGKFIKKENEVKYKRELELYLNENKIKNPSPVDINNFQRREINRFIRNHPLEWGFLQIKKVLYTYGIIPIRDNLTILMTGHLKFGILLSLLLSQVTFVIPIIILFVFFSWNRLKELRSNDSWMMLVLVFIYLIGATSLYGHYQERYRIVVMVSAIIPFSALFFQPGYFKTIFTNKRRFVTKIVALLFLFSVWGYQAYDALVLQGDRYLKAVETIHK
jgi:hypothetical protein